MRTQFPYRKEDSRLFGVIYRPVAAFEIKTKVGWVPVVAYIDSGADLTLLPKSFMDLLDIKFQQKDVEEVSGVGGGKLPVVVKEAQLRLCKTVLKVKVGVALIEKVPYLLGRADVFPRFKICFREKEKTISFQRE